MNLFACCGESVGMLLALYGLIIGLVMIVPVDAL